MAYGDSLVNLVSIETITQESTGLALCERQCNNNIMMQINKAILIQNGIIAVCGV
jgi:hypothetical protein